MKKENILVVVLVVLAVAGGYIYNTTKSSEPLAQGVIPLKPESKTAVENSSKINESDISWKGYTPGLALAGKTNKPIFLYFSATWCTYCAKLKQTTFKDKRILEYLEKNFVSIQVDTDKNQKLSNEWKVRGLPTLWFLEPDGTKINSIPGYLNANQLLLVLKYIHTKSYSTTSFQDFMKQG
ncbi:MAG: thioredoxin family protein [Desulfobacteraceae bacterium]|nr:thioredoxin family protein [Desulfobacteraceae bacterium]